MAAGKINFFEVAEMNELFLIRGASGTKSPMKGEEWKIHQVPHTYEAIRERIKEVRGHNGNFMVLLGAASGGVIVFDCESEEVFGKFFDEDILSRTLVVRTGKGFHVFFRVLDYSTPISNIQVQPHIELRGEGNLVLVPPSIHPNGKRYKVVSSVVEIAALNSTSAEVVADFRKKVKEKLGIDLTPKISAPSGGGAGEVTLPKNLELLISNGAAEGNRNATTFEVLKAAYRLGLDEDNMALLALRFNSNCRPPRSEEEVRRHAKETYAQLLRDKPRKDGKVKERFKFITAKDLMDAPETPQEWVVEDFIPEGLTILGGRGGCGKSMLALHLAMCVSSGQKFLEFGTNPRSVFYLDGEMGQAETARRLRLLGGANNENLLFDFLPEVYLDGEEDYFHVLAEKNPGCVFVVDSLTRVLGVDENESRSIQKALGPLRRLCESHKVSFVLLHHERKKVKGQDAEDAIRGSTDIRNIADCVYLLSKPREGTIILHHNKARVGVAREPTELYISERDGRLSFEYRGTIEEALTLPKIAAQALVDWLWEGKREFFKRAEALEFLGGKGYKTGTQKTAFRIVQENGIIFQKKDLGKGFWGADFTNLHNFLLKTPENGMVKMVKDGQNEEDE